MSSLIIADATSTINEDVWIPEDLHQVTLVSLGDGSLPKGSSVWERVVRVHRVEHSESFLPLFLRLLSVMWSFRPSRIHIVSGSRFPLPGLRQLIELSCRIARLRPKYSFYCSGRRFPDTGDLAHSKVLPPWRVYLLAETFLIGSFLLLLCTILPLEFVLCVIVLVILCESVAVLAQPRTGYRTCDWVRRFRRNQQLKFFCHRFGERLLSDREVTDVIEVVELGVHRESTYRLDGDGRRVVPLSQGRISGPRVAVFGCSYVFGLSVDTGATLCDHLSRLLPKTRVLNMGVPGYSTYQCLLLMEEFLEQEAPDVIVFGMQANHDPRNVLRRDELHWYAGPHSLARGPRSEIRTFAPSSYAYLPLSGRFRTVKAVERALNKLYSVVGGSSDETGRSTTRALLLRMKRLCDSKNVPLLVIGLDTHHAHGAFLRSEGFFFAQSGVDLWTPSGIRHWTDPTLDPTHPNERAHLHYAEVIAPALSAVLQGEIPPDTPFKSIPVSPSSRDSDEVYPLF